MKLEDSSHSVIHPRCMTKVDWVEAQSKDKTIDEILQLFKTKGFHGWKGKETDIDEMKQFIR